MGVEREGMRIRPTVYKSQTCQANRVYEDIDSIRNTKFVTQLSASPDRAGRAPVSGKTRKYTKILLGIPIFLTRRASAVRLAEQFLLKIFSPNG